MMNSAHADEVGRGERFKFGANWTRFLSLLNEERIVQAETSLCEFLNVDDLKGKSFLDAGSGSGLFSLAARRLGARVHSFDFDAQSVSCTQELKNRYFSGDSLWTIEEASVLDREFLSGLGKFDVVYSWGVLHHTGAMWNALENVVPLVKDGGQLFLAIYNDQGWLTRYWTFIKKSFVSSRLVGGLILAFHLPYLYILRYFVRALNRKGGPSRGMSIWYDMLDWIGGYPFEVARPEGVFEFYSARRFDLKKLKTCGGRHGCNEFVFSKRCG